MVFREALKQGGREKEREEGRRCTIMARFAEVTSLSDTPHAKKFAFGGREETGERLKKKVKAAVNRLYQKCFPLELPPDLVV